MIARFDAIEQLAAGSLAARRSTTANQPATSRQRPPTRLEAAVADWEIHAHRPRWPTTPELPNTPLESIKASLRSPVGACPRCLPGAADGSPIPPTAVESVASPFAGLTEQ
jgi:hypothetical protein